MYNLYGISKKYSEENPDTRITITWLIFLNSLIMIAIKVKGITNFKPSCSGTIEPTIIPKIVDTCQANHNRTPEPIK